MADLKSFVPNVDPRKYAQEFREFLLKSNMFALAMGVVHRRRGQGSGHGDRRGSHHAHRGAS